MMIAALPAMVAMECLKKYLTTQGNMGPILPIAVLVLVVELACLGFVSVFYGHFQLRVEHGAIAWTICFWSSATLLCGYVWWSDIWRHTLADGWNWDCLKATLSQKSCV